jgi:hypothetical protein
VGYTFDGRVCASSRGGIEALQLLGIRSPEAMKREVKLAAVGEGCKVNSSGLHAASNFVQDPLKDSDRISAEKKAGGLF